MEKDFENSLKNIDTSEGKTEGTDSELVIDFVDDRKKIFDNILVIQNLSNKWISLYKLWKYEEWIKKFDEAIKLILTIRNIDIPEEKTEEIDSKVVIESIRKKLLDNFSLSNLHKEKWKALFELWKYEESIKEFDEAIKLSPNILYYYIKINTLYELWKYEETLQTIKQWLEIKSDDKTMLDLKKLLEEKIK